MSQALLNMPSWVAAPVLLPLLSACLMLLIPEQRRLAKAGLNLASTLLSLLLAVLMIYKVQGLEEATVFGVYLSGNWEVPFGIVLVADRLSALLVLLTSCLAVASLLYSLARWHQAGVYFHALFQLQLMGLYGAFLTADLFNLFVFFEVMLAASYGLLLHGGGLARVRAGLHYVAVNLLASLLFLVGIAMVYGVAGSLNLADVAARMALIPAEDRGLMYAAAAILALAFLTKAALWPLNGWLPAAYTAASAPVGALFVIMTKVGIYSVLRLWTLLFPVEAEQGALFGSGVLIWGGIATLVFASVAMLASLSILRFAAYSIVLTAGTLMAALGFNEPLLASGALYYLSSSTLAAGVLFLLAEMLERSRQESVQVQRDDGGALPMFGEGAEVPPDANLDDEQQAMVGLAIPFAMAFLGVTFTLCVLVVAGLPPLSGFVGKVLMLMALVEIQSLAAWSLFFMLILSGLAAVMALVRGGMRHFWVAMDYPAPRLRIIETLPVALLLGACVLLVVMAEDVVGYMDQAAYDLHHPQAYVQAVLGSLPVDALHETVPGDEP